MLHLIVEERIQLDGGVGAVGNHHRDDPAPRLISGEHVLRAPLDHGGDVHAVFSEEQGVGNPVLGVCKNQKRRKSGRLTEEGDSASHRRLHSLGNRTRAPV